MKIVQKIKDFLSRYHHEGVDKYSSQNKHDRDLESEYESEREKNSLNFKSASVRGVRPYANNDERDVTAI